ncbi:uncharacterized protein LOC135385282 [Ornithodoros turicata]|uniref:uncharacterized protein LOC135385282 n=1 Tax=Ornithodoros turicata TaxID=34597 RepID=UPI0031395ADE
MGCNLGKGSQADETDDKGSKRSATSPQTPPPEILGERKQRDENISNRNNHVADAMDKAVDRFVEEKEKTTQQFSDPVIEFVPENEVKEIEAAATKIQATFRGYKVRKETEKVARKESNREAHTETNMKEDDDQPKNTSSEQDELADLDLNDPNLSKAACVIQATFRGHRVRKSPIHQAEGESTGKDETTRESSLQSAQQDEEDVPDEIKDLDLNDPDLAKAAVKIQSTFRGYKTRNK